MSEAVLVKPGKNKYLVLNSVTNTYDEHPVKLADTPVGKFLEILVLPPVLVAGFLSYKKEVFHVTLHNLLRSKVNVTNPITLNAPTATSSTTLTRTQSTVYSNQLGSQAGSGDELSKESDLCWEEQIAALQYSED